MGPSSGSAAQVSDLLARAIQCLNTDDAVSAERQLRQALALDPREPVAMFLLGLVQFQRGRWADAEPLFRQALAITPGEPRASLQLARTLRALGRPAEAAAICRSLLSRAPGDPLAGLELAKAEEEGGDVAAAESAYRRLLARMPGWAPAVLPLGDLLIAGGRGVEAEQILRPALAAGSAPEQDGVEAGALEHRLGLALKIQRRYVEALARIDQALARAPANNRLLHSRAAVLQHLRRFDEAAGTYEAILTSDPVDMEAHLHLNELLYRQRRDEVFLKSYAEASRRAPKSVDLPNAMGQFLLKAGRPREARSAFERALAIASGDPAALIGLGRALEAEADLDQALRVHETCISLHPENTDALVAGASFLLRNGEPRRALKWAARGHARGPADQAAIAIMGLCYRALRDDRDDYLNNYAADVRVFDLDPPDGYADMEAFSRDLASYLDGLHGDARENFTQTLRGGTRLYGEIFNNGHDLVDRLRVRIDEAVGGYIANMRADRDHPYTSRRTGAFAYSGSWSSRTGEEGFHVNHIHPGGWISSTYYVAVPEVAADPDAKRGWLKFGEPTDDFGPAFTPRRVIQPKPGRLAVFPSYMWHGTTPHRSPQARATIAFDIVPRPGRSA